MDQEAPRGTEIVCVEAGFDVRSRMTLLAGVDVDAALAELNRVAGPGLVWRRPETYREPLNVVCGKCGGKHCQCPRGDHRSDRFDVATGRRA